jgi:hypothetical protein
MPDPEPIGDLMNHRFEAATGLVHTLAVGDAQAYQRHRCSGLRAVG